MAGENRELDAKEISVGRLLHDGDYEFVIPEYQRPYAWGTEESVQLLADLVDRHVKTLVEGQKACQTTERKATDAAKGKCTADNRTDNIAHISKLCIDRS